jgi:hypothetical protein
MGTRKVVLMVADLTVLLDRPLKYDPLNDKTLGLAYCGDVPIRIADRDLGREGQNRSSESVSPSDHCKISEAQWLSVSLKLNKK